MKVNLLVAPMVRRGSLFVVRHTEIQLELEKLKNIYSYIKTTILTWQIHIWVSRAKQRRL